MAMAPWMWMTAALAWSAVASADPATDFTLRDLNGEAVSLSDHRGDVILIDFWATWCGPCKDELPHLQAIYDDLADEGFVVLALSTDEARSKGLVKPYIKRAKLTFPVLYDTDNEALVAYNPSKVLPFSVVIDRDFTVASMHSGYEPGDEAELRAEIEALVRGDAEDPPPAPEPADDDVPVADDPPASAPAPAPE